MRWLGISAGGFGGRPTESAARFRKDDMQTGPELTQARRALAKAEPGFQKSPPSHAIQISHESRKNASANMSHHLDSPIARQDPRLDITGRLPRRTRDSLRPARLPLARRRGHPPEAGTQTFGIGIGVTA